MSRPPKRLDESAPLTAEELPRVFRDRARGRAAHCARRRSAGVVWAGGAVVVVALIGIAIVFREERGARLAADRVGLRRRSACR